MSHALVGVMVDADTHRTVTCTRHPDGLVIIEVEGEAPVQRRIPREPGALREHLRLVSAFTREVAAAHGLTSLPGPLPPRPVPPPSPPDHPFAWWPEGCGRCRDFRHLAANYSAHANSNRNRASTDGLVLVHLDLPLDVLEDWDARETTEVAALIAANPPMDEIAGGRRVRQ